MTTPSRELRHWVDMVLECVRRDHTPALSTGDQRGPFLTARAMGMALAALNDAHAIASGGVPLLAVAATPGLDAAEPVLAAAAACHQLLRLRYPKQARLLDPAWSRWRELHRPGVDGADEAAGRAFGASVHAIGLNDPVDALPSYVPSGLPYTHIAPPSEPGQGYAGGGWGMAPPLLASRVPNFPPPPGRISANAVVDTQHFRDDFAKVAAKGIDQRGSGTRTLDEEIIGIYWGYDGPPELGTPPRLYLQVALAVLDGIEAANPGALDVADELAVIAGMGIALADAGIDAWHYKYSPAHMMWRPVVGIQRAEPNNGTANPGWLPLGRPDTNNLGQRLTPDFPAYPSGHATFGAATFQVLRLFLAEKGIATFDACGEDDINFDFVSDEFNGRNADPRTMLPRELLTRGYASLWDAIVDNSVSRVFLGVHWQFDGITVTSAAEPSGAFGIPASPAELGQIGGVWLGMKIANQIALQLGVTADTIERSEGRDCAAPVLCAIAAE